MRKLVFILLALLAGIGTEAQETLIPINEETASIKGYDKEIERLLVPANTESEMFGNQRKETSTMRPAQRCTSCLSVKRWYKQ